MKTQLFLFFLTIIPLMVQGQKKPETQIDSLLQAHSAIIDKQVIPTDTTVRTGVLKNGLTYYVRRCTEPEKKANFHLLVKGGSVVEKESERGIAHFVEHMMFKGTKHFPGQNVIGFMRRNGIVFGNESNAFTSFNTVRYFLNGISVLDELQIDSCLLLLRDWAGNATIADEDVERERQVIVEEWRSRTAFSKQEVTNDILNNSIYTKRMPIGDIEVVQHCSPQLIRSFYKRWYQPQNMAVVVTGDFDADVMVEKIRRQFGKMNRGKNIISKYPIIPDYETPQYRVYQDDKSTAHTISITIKLPKNWTEQENTVGDVRLSLLYKKITNLMFNRLKPLENTDILNCETSIFNPIYTNNAFFMSFNLFASASWQQTLELLAKQIETIRRMGFTEYVPEKIWSKCEYNEDVTALILPQLLPQNVSTLTSNECADRLTYSFFNGGTIDDYYSEKVSEKHILRTITREQLDMLFRELTDSRNIIIAASIPNSEPQPTEDELKAIVDSVKGLSDEELTIKSTQRAEKLEMLFVDSIELNPVPGTLKKLTALNDSISEAFLSNGIKVVLWKWRGEAVRNIAISFGRPMGTSALPDDKIHYCNLLSPCRRKYIYEVGYHVEVNPFDDKLHTDMYTKKDAKDYWDCVEYLLKQTHALLITTEVDSVEAAEKIKDIQIDAASNANDPISQAALRISKLPYVSLKRVSPPTVDEAKMYTVDRFREVVKDYFSNFNGSVLIVRGDFDTDTIMPLLLKYIGSLPSKPETVDRKVWPSDHFKTTNSTVVEKISNATPYCETNLFYTWEKDYCYTPENHAHNEVLQSILSKLLWDVLRVEHSDVYTPQCWMQDEQMPFPRLMFAIAYVCDPTQRERIAKDVCQIVQDIAEGGLITQGLIDSYIKEREKNVGKVRVDDYVLRSAYLDRELGYTIIQYNDLSIFKQVTPASLKAHLRQLLKKGNIHIGYLTT
ncbi:MAG: insulinase family protein [Prevotella sp.]|nr:insulinase family protein [Prevotella sp.]